MILAEEVTMSGTPWRKATPESIERFQEAAASIPDVELRRMFGYPAAFVDGNMAFGLHQETVMVRLPEQEREARLAAGWSAFEPMPGRPMREYVALPVEVASDLAQTRTWMERAAEYARTLPPKAPKPRRRS
jgi:TfoX/Sxy family transcriptional regulator of competence genes